MTMTFDRYRDFVLSKVSVQTISRDQELAAALGLCGETGEIADLIKKQRFQDHHVYHGWLLEELGDVYFYFVLMLDAMGYTLDQVIDENVRKLEERYPEGFDPDRSMNRT